MGGVDRDDQLWGYYNCRTKSHKFYKYIFYFIFDVTITNAFILYKHFHPSPFKTIKEFHLQLAWTPIGDYCSRRWAGHCGGSILPLQLQHYPLKVSAKSSPAKNEKGTMCILHSAPPDSSWYCRAVCGCATKVTQTAIVFTCGIRTGWTSYTNYCLMFIPYPYCNQET